MSIKFKIDTEKLNNSINEQVTSFLNEQKYDVSCPHCNREVNIPAGKSLCPCCNNEINLDLNIKFK